MRPCLEDIGMTADQQPSSPGRPGRRGSFGRRDLVLAVAATATLALATWGTARLPRPAAATTAAAPAAPAATPAVLPGVPSSPPLPAVALRAPALRPPEVPVVVPIPAPGSAAATAMAPGFVIAPAAALVPTLPAVQVVARAPLVAGPRPLSAMSAVASARLTAAERRAAREAKARADSVARVAPLEHVLRRYSSNRTLTRRIAAAVVRESRRSKVDPSLVVAVLVAENDVLKPHARNPHTSARGLMQVMPRWAGRLGCGSSDLADVDANICHGVRVLALHLREARGDLHHGLQRFNGCRRTAGSTRCDVYPNRVLAHAERLEGQMETFARRQRERSAK
jgi:hypothetical protein